MTKMKNVLLIGNGFDLAHGLLTNYKDFLTIMKIWGDFKKNVDLACENRVYDTQYEKYLSAANKIDKNKIDKLDSIFKNNSWVDYYKRCEAELNGWIDFEKEMQPVLKLFNEVMSLDLNIEVVNQIVTCFISKDSLSAEMQRVANLWERYFIKKYTVQKVKVGYEINSKYLSNRSGLLKEKLIEDLRSEFNQFIEALEIYLEEFVVKKDSGFKLEEINKNRFDVVISFNYTEIEKNYLNINLDNVYHIHGNLSATPNNMVLGVNEIKDDIKNDFIYFVKYFQRIQKRSSIAYKKELEEPFDLYVYGHSLDVSDKDILEELFHKAKHVTIYYYSQKDYETKVINLISNFGRSFLEKKLETQEIELIEIRK